MKAVSSRASTKLLPNTGLVRLLICIAGAVCSAGFSSALGGDSPSVLVTVKSDGKVCVVRHFEASCLDLPGVLANDLGIAKDATVSVSPEECGDGAFDHASNVASSLRKAGFTKVAVVGFLSEPNRKCAPRENVRAELEANRAKWSAANIHDYEFRLRDEDCFCLFGPAYGPIRNVIRADKLQESIYEGERRDGYWRGRKVRIGVQTRATINEVFARVERLIETAAEGSFRVLYDASYGFPTLVEFDDPDMEDEQSRLVADGFKLLSVAK